MPLRGTVNVGFPPRPLLEGRVCAVGQAPPARRSFSAAQPPGHEERAVAGHRDAGGESQDPLLVSLTSSRVNVVHRRGFFNGCMLPCDLWSGCRASKRVHQAGFDACANR